MRNLIKRFDIYFGSYEFLQDTDRDYGHFFQNMLIYTHTVLHINSVTDPLM